MKGKCMPHIIAVMILVIFIVLGLASATTPKSPPSPEQIVFDPNIPENQTTTLFVAPHWRITKFCETASVSKSGDYAGVKCKRSFV